jgi:hypothetical protein
MDDSSSPHAALDPRRLSFGQLAAENDSEMLKSYFFESEAFTQFAAGKKYVALGNRGSGKSAIFKMLAQRHRAAGGIVVELAPEDYSYEILSQTLTAESHGNWAKHGAYAAAWKYVLYVLTMKAATNQGSRLKTGSAAKIYEYLRDKHQGTDTNPIGTLISYLKRLEGIKVGKYEASVKSRELQQLYRLEEINALLPDLNELCKNRKVMVLVDELDKGWDSSEDAKSFVAGLFQAAVSINNTTPNVRVLISLRKELYDSIPSLYEDAQKVRDFIETIEWDEPQLLTLIAKRIAHSFPELASLTQEQLWSNVFAPVLDYRQTKSFNYLVDRTLYRPRELIQFCGDVQRVALKASLPANYQTVTEAEHGYSAARLADIAAEYRFQYAGLKGVFETFRGLPHTFDREALELHCFKLATGELHAAEASKWIADQSPDFIIDVLWRVGFLRAQAVGGIKARRRSGSTYLGPHQIEILNLANISRFHVHPMFRAFLAMKEPKRAPRADGSGAGAEVADGEEE